MPRSPKPVTEGVSLQGHPHDVPVALNITTRVLAIFALTTRALATRALPTLTLTTLVLAILVSCASCGSPRKLDAQTALPNVLLVTLDTTRADRLGCYGYTRPTTPVIDAVARKGVLFERAVAQASMTPVSHASIFTGLYPYHHGLRVLHGRNGFELSERFPTLASLFGTRGYDTAAFVSAFPAGSRFGLNHGFTTFNEEFESSDGKGIVTPEGVVNTGQSQRTAAQTNRSVFEWLGHCGAGPHFVWVHYFDPHDPHVLPEDETSRNRFAPTGPSKKDLLVALYDSEIAYMDSHLGRLVVSFAALGRPLLLVIVGDHGQGLGDHGWWGHGLLYEEQIRVPFIMRGAGVPEGKRIRSLVRTVDIFPTLLAMIDETAGTAAPAPPAVDGVDLTGLLRGKTDLPDLEGYSDSPGILDYTLPFDPAKKDIKTDMVFSLTRSRWKYIYHLPGHAPDELYDLDADPHETRNVAPSQPEIAAQLKAAIVKRPLLPEGASPPPELSREEIDRLRSLGYVPPPVPR